MSRQVTPPADVADEPTENRSMLVPAGTDDLYLAATATSGVPVPDHFKTKNRRWAVLILLIFAGACARGPTSSWPTLEPMLIKEHVFAGPSQLSQLSHVYSLSLAINLISNLFCGLIFDVLGGRITSYIAAAGTGTCLVCMGLAVKFESLNWLLWIAYPGSSFFGNMFGFGAWAWYWLLPEDQNFVSALLGAIQILADSFVVVATWMNEAGVPVYYFFYLVASFALFSGIIAWMFVPTLEEQEANAAAVIKFMYSPPSSSDAQYGSCEGQAGDTTITSSPEQAAQDGSQRSPWADLKAKFRESFTWWTRMYPTAQILALAYQIAAYMVSAYPSIVMFPLYKGLMGAHAANKLVSVNGSLYGPVGCVTLLTLGRFCDAAGYIKTIWLCVPPTILASYLFSVHSYDWQIVGQVFMAFNANTYRVTALRFFQYYAPPELLGTLYGLQGAFAGIAQKFLDPLAKSIANAAGFHDTAQYLFIIALWCSLFVIFTGAQLVYWRYRPIPKVGSVSMEQVWAAASTETSKSSREDHKEEEANPKCDLEAQPGKCKNADDRADAKRHLVEDERVKGS